MLTETLSIDRFDDLELRREQRRHRRHRVHLQVRFGRAADYVAQYAENLSKGGLFVRGVCDVEIDSEIDIELELPGYCRFNVTARVAHRRTPGEAGDGHPGVGLEILGSPPGFDLALHSYLRHLGRRRDFVVLASDPDAAALLDDAGYRVSPLPGPGAVASYAEQLATPLLAVVIDRSRTTEYLTAEDLGASVVEIGPGGVAELLSELDARIQSWR